MAGAALRCQPDARLVALARDGYPRAFDEITRRYRAALVSFAGSIVPAHRAEDVVQDGLVKAYRSLPRSEEELNLRPWLYTIVRNTALNDLRDQRAHEHLDENWDGVPQPAEVAAERAELASLVRRIQGLPAPQREALVSRELEGKSHAEIASTMGATPGAVRGLIFRARAALRDGAGILIPLPVLRTLLEAGPLQAETAGVGIGGAAAGLSAGGGGAAIKAGATLLVAGLAVGSGVAIHNRDRPDARAQSIAQHAHASPGRGQSSAPGASADGFRSSGGGDSSSGPGPGANSGPGPGHSGPGPSEGATGGNREDGGHDRGSDGEGSDDGPHHGGVTSGHQRSGEAGDHSGGGGHGGHGGTSGESGGDNSGSGSSGSASASSGSGSSGSGSGTSGSSGRGSSGGGSDRTSSELASESESSSEG